MSEGRAPAGEEHLIRVEDAEITIEHHPEDWLAFAIFWSLGLIVFLQFFTRYILNDSLSWTEEIARYGLMWVTFIGGAIMVRKNQHIAVEVMLHMLPAGSARVLMAAIDVVKLGFLALLFYFSIIILDRMQIQRMTVIDLPMSLVYGGITVGCFLMLARQIQIFVRNVRDGWRGAQKAIGEGLVID